MTEDQNKLEPEQQSRLPERPDPAFKVVTRKFAKELGLETIETEFPQTLRADLILGVPEGLVLENTLFSFFRRFNIIEFKGENDPFNEAGFVRNEIRTDLLYLYNQEAHFENMLNLIVSSRFPRRFFDYMEARHCKFEQDKDRPWFWRCQVGLQEVAVVVCRDLPIEPLYYEWLLFAPSDSQKWRDFVTMLARQGNFALLEQAQEMRPEEYKFMSVALKELLKEYTPKERKRHLKALLSIYADDLSDVAKEAPEDLSIALSKLTPEERLAGITPEERQRLLELLTKDDKKPE